MKYVSRDNLYNNTAIKSSTDVGRGFYKDCGVSEKILNQLIVFGKSKDGDLYCWNSTPQTCSSLLKIFLGRIS